jgi:hypothetical protein
MASPYLVVAFAVGGVAVAILVTASVDGSICGDKVNTPLHLADPPSFVLAAVPPRHRWDLLRFDPKSPHVVTPNRQPINSMLPSPAGNFADLVPIRQFRHPMGSWRELLQQISFGRRRALPKQAHESQLQPTLCAVRPRLRRPCGPPTAASPTPAPAPASLPPSSRRRRTSL